MNTLVMPLGWGDGSPASFQLGPAVAPQMPLVTHTSPAL